MIKDILVILGLGCLAYILFGTKSPSPILTNPKIQIPNKVAEIANQVSNEIGSTVGTINVPSVETVHNSSGDNHLQEFFKIN